MRCALVEAALAATASAHGLVTRIQGANGVVMPGLSVADGTPRDCSSNGCGSQADTSIIRARDIRSGSVSPLGRTQGNGPVNANAVISAFMGTGGAARMPTNNGASGSVGQEDDLSGLEQMRQQRREAYRRQLDKLFGGLGGLGGLGGGAGGAGGAGAAGKKAGGLGGLGGLGDLGGGAGAAGRKAGRLAGLGGLGGLLGGAGAGGTKNNAAAESMIADTAGMGAQNGLPTADENGQVPLVFRQ
ncbi:hypothetical protein E4U54_004716, partial [Claviceps lovelessii]